jgi:hypothetical protein
VAALSDAMSMVSIYLWPAAGTVLGLRLRSVQLSLSKLGLCRDAGQGPWSLDCEVRVLSARSTRLI